MRCFARSNRPWAKTSATQRIIHCGQLLNKCCSRQNVKASMWKKFLAQNKHAEKTYRNTWHFKTCCFSEKGGKMGVVSGAMESLGLSLSLSLFLLLFSLDLQLSWKEKGISLLWLCWEPLYYSYYPQFFSLSYSLPCPFCYWESIATTPQFYSTLAAMLAAFDKEMACIKFPQKINNTVYVI